MVDPVAEQFNIVRDYQLCRSRDTVREKYAKIGISAAFVDCAIDDCISKDRGAYFGGAAALAGFGIIAVGANIVLAKYVGLYLPFVVIVGIGAFVGACYLAWRGVFVR